MYGSIPATVFRDGTPQQLSDEQEGLKREIYERMNPRRRKFVDRIGYENWDLSRSLTNRLICGQMCPSAPRSSWSTNF